MSVASLNDKTPFIVLISIKVEIKFNFAPSGEFLNISFNTLGTHGTMVIR